MWTYLAIDWGTKKTGLALGNPTLKLAVPRDVVATAQVIEHLSNILKANPIQTVVLGLPLTLTLTKTATTVNIEEFSAQLQSKYPKLTIIHYNERGSSKVSIQKLRDRGLDNRKIQNYDSLAACEILQNYFRETL
ncbi:MAG: Holliday junction resolvase RuvX [Candidatus Parcubacteria bacterium]|nr:Holliday junction resolvase RuvX [Candidatus Paceibacterota bacterium]